jgi:hypothetical protein
MQIAEPIENLEITDPTPAAFKQLPPFLPAPTPRTRELPSRPAINRRHCLAGHYESPDIANIPFALTVFVLWGTGLIAAACGIIGDSAGLAVIGSLITLVAGLLNGWGLCDA